MPAIITPAACNTTTKKNIPPLPYRSTVRRQPTNAPIAHASRLLHACTPCRNNNTLCLPKEEVPHASQHPISDRPGLKHSSIERDPPSRGSTIRYYCQHVDIALPVEPVAVRSEHLNVVHSLYACRQGKTPLRAERRCGRGLRFVAFMLAIFGVYV